MGSKILDVGTFCDRLHDVPDGFRCNSCASDPIASTYSAEDCAAVCSCRSHPFIDGAFRPRRNGNGTNVFSFANQVSDQPMLLADLEIFCSESNQFGPSQSASDEQRQNRALTFPSLRSGLRLPFLPANRLNLGYNIAPANVELARREQRRCH